MHHSMRARLLATGTAFALLSGPAFALDSNDLMTKINAALTVQGGSLQADKIDVSGSTVTLNGAKFKPAAGPETFPLGTVTLNGVAEDNGGYAIEKVTFPNINASKEGTTVTVSDISLSDVAVPADATKNTLGSLLIYGAAHVGPASVSLNGKTVFAMGEANMTTDIADDDSSLDFDVKLDKLSADLSTVDDPNTRETIDALGLNSLNGDISMNGSWTQNDGTIDVEDYALDFAKIGKLSMAFSISGYTLDFIKSAQETAKQMEANTNKEEAQQAANLAMLGLMQRLTFNSADISFKDDGITQRALDYAGKKQNATGEQMAQMLKAMTPLVLAQYNIPELQNMLSQAVNTYLDKPDSLTVTIEPPKPVPFPMIMGAAMGAPNTLPKVLGVKVSAND